MKFYFDSYNKVKCSESLDFQALFIADDQQYELCFFHGEAELPFAIQLRKKYYILRNEEKHLVQYRFITTTSQFEEETKYDGVLGHVYSPKQTDFYVWAPTAYSLSVVLVEKQLKYPAKVSKEGVYHVTILGDLDGVGYKLEVEHDQIMECLDPYAISSTIDSKYNYVINPSKIHKVTPLIHEIPKEQCVIYEVHVRDFTYDSTVNFECRGLFKGMTQQGCVNSFGDVCGVDHLLNLGVTHVQLLPIYDFGSIRENQKAREYNWGYDPVQYNVLEGKYATDPCDPYNRINECIEMISSFHELGLGVNMDVVYNHVFNDVSFSYDVLVPYYYFRYQGGKKSNASFCGNEVASEHYMVSKFMKDSLIYLTKTFDFSGYRFDLMGIHDMDTMNDIVNVLKEIKPLIHIYGEGWAMPTAISHDNCVIQQNHKKVKEIGFFNDYFRNEVKSITASFKQYHFEEKIKSLLLATQYTSPKQSIQYVSCHDDYTLYDHLYYDFQCDDVVKRMQLAYIFVCLGHGIPFIHAGCEAGRTKLGVKNSYKSSIELNQINWSLVTKNKKLVNYIKELLRLRKSIATYQSISYDEIMKSTSFEFFEGGFMYQVDDVCFYINLTSSVLTRKIEGEVISSDGQAICDHVKKQMIQLEPFSYVAVRRV